MELSDRAPARALSTEEQAKRAPQPRAILFNGPTTAEGATHATPRDTKVEHDVHTLTGSLRVYIIPLASRATWYSKARKTFSFFPGGMDAIPRKIIMCTSNGSR